MTFEIALTGLNAASKELAVISNNIANSSTSGFKRSRAEFSDVYASSDLGVAANATGEGVKVSNIRQQFSQGDINFTSNNLDLSVSGAGMFRISDHGSIVYSRAGMFGIDREGFIVNAQDQRLTGYTADANGEIMPTLGDLRIDASDLPPAATEDITIGMTLDVNAEVPVPNFSIDDPTSYNFSTSAMVYDSQGTAHVTSFYYRNEGANVWTAHMYIDDQEIGRPGGDEIAFNPDGTLLSINGAAGIATLSSQANFQPAGNPGVQPMSLTIDYAGVTQYDSNFGVNEVVVDGYNSGRLADLEINSNGIIFGRYTNGQSQAMGQIVLTNFANPEGLRQVGNTNWSETFASGAPAVGTPASASLGLIQSSALEASNVDITKELVDMIGAQRNFQANAQIVSVSDQLTQSIINIRR